MAEDQPQPLGACNRAGVIGLVRTTHILDRERPVAGYQASATAARPRGSPQDFRGKAEIAERLESTRVLWILAF